ncbi:MAG: hypothetical protein IJ106_06920 [Parasporobacterium sp.]|nr:hypothetical protein [Parasporobacterium sp.]
MKKIISLLICVAMIGTFAVSAYGFEAATESASEPATIKTAQDDSTPILKPEKSDAEEESVQSAAPEKAAEIKVPEGIAGTIPGLIPEEVSDGEPEEIFGEIAEEISEEVPEEILEEVPEEEYQEGDSLGAISGLISGIFDSLGVSAEEVGEAVSGILSEVQDALSDASENISNEIEEKLEDKEFQEKLENAEEILENLEDSDIAEKLEDAGKEVESSVGDILGQVQGILSGIFSQQGSDNGSDTLPFPDFGDSDGIEAPDTDEDETAVPDLDKALNGGMIVGGWSVSTEFESQLTAEQTELFEKATAGLLGVNYTPVAVLATQLVAGTNYAYLCSGSSVIPGAQTDWCILTIYADLQGNATVLNIDAIDLGDVKTIENASPSEFVGAWKILVPEKAAALPEDAQEAFDAVTGSLENISLDPIVLLGTQVVAGTNYKILCCGQLQDAKSAGALYVVDIYKDPDGNSYVSDLQYFDLSSYIGYGSGPEVDD